MNLNKNKLLKLMLILLIIILICLVVLLNIDNNGKEIEEIPINVEENIDYLEEDTIIPENSYIFFSKYIYGDVTSKVLYEEINKFVISTIPKYYNLLNEKSDTEIEKYFVEYKNEIVTADINIANSDNFIKFINQLKKTKGSTEVKYIKFVEDSIISTDTYTCASVIVVYKDNIEIQFNIKVYLTKQKDEKSILFYY